MSNNIEYQEVLEAIGMLANRSTIVNKLNKIFAHTKDIELRSMVGSILVDISSESGINTKRITLRDSNRIKTKKIEYYCREKLERDLFQEPMSRV